MNSAKILVTLLLSICFIMFHQYAYAGKTRPITEHELKTVIEVMSLSQSKKYNNVLKLLKEKKLTFKRLQILLSDIAMVTPYVSTDNAVSSSIIKRKLNEKDYKKLAQARALAKKEAEQYLLKNKLGGNESLTETVELISKYRKQIENHILPAFQTIEKPKKDEVRPLNRTESIQNYRLLNPIK